MGTALHRRDQVDVAFGQQFTAFRQPQQRPVNRFGIAGEGADERFFRQQRQAVNRFAKIVGQTIGVAPALFAVVNQIAENNLYARAENGLGL